MGLCDAAPTVFAFSPDSLEATRKKEKEEKQQRRRCECVEEADLAS